jgi:hypothetical protein
VVAATVSGAIGQRQQEKVSAADILVGGAIGIEYRSTQPPSARLGRCECFFQRCKLGHHDLPRAAKIGSESQPFYVQIRGFVGNHTLYQGDRWQQRFAKTFFGVLQSPSLKLVQGWVHQR